MEDLPENANTHHKASYTEWDNFDLLVYDENDELINIYRDFDIIDLVIENHNKYLWDKKEECECCGERS